MKKNIYIIGIILIFSLTMTSCGIGEGSLTDGAYGGEGKGYNSTIKVNIAVEKGMISGLQIVEHGDTEEIFEKASTKIGEEIIGKESTEKIEVVSGATSSSKGLIEAINKALESAK